MMKSPRNEAIFLSFCTRKKPHFEIVDKANWKEGYFPLNSS